MVDLKVACFSYSMEEVINKNVLFNKEIGTYLRNSISNITIFFIPNIILLFIAVGKDPSDM